MTVSQSRKTLQEAERAYATAATGRDLTEAREWLTVARASHYRDCVEVVERLGALLEPVSNESAAWHWSTNDHEAIACVRDMDDYVEPVNRFMTVGDLRAIAKLYEEVK